MKATLLTSDADLKLSVKSSFGKTFSTSFSLHNVYICRRRAAKSDNVHSSLMQLLLILLKDLAKSQHNCLLHFSQLRMLLLLSHKEIESSIVCLLTNRFASSNLAIRQGHIGGSVVKRCHVDLVCVPTNKMCKLCRFDQTSNEKKKTQ